MRENIFPIWEAPENKKGGCWSYMISKLDIDKIWIKTSIKLIGETLTNIDNIYNINGISLSPRTNVGIIKIWTKTNKKFKLKRQNKSTMFIFK